MAAPTEHVESGPAESEPDRPEPAGTPGDPESSDREAAARDPDANPDADADPGSEVDDEDADGAEPPGPKIRDTPEDIRLEAIANTVALHPNRDLLVCGDVDGDLYAFSYSRTEGQNRELWSSGHHLKSCRQVRFSEDGLRLYSVSRDRAVHQLDVERGALLSRIRGAHGAAINSLLLVDQNILATGDDGGTLKVWDMRKGTSIMEEKQHDDYISDIAVDSAKRILLTTSGDGTLGAFNLKRRRFHLRSEPQSADLTAAVLMKRGRKVACGSSEGTVYIFDWNGFGATSDRFALRAESVDCMAPINEHIVCAGATDGYIRAVNLLPNRVLGCVGQHPGEPVEELATSADRRLLVSAAHDQLLKFWDVSALHAATVSDYRRKKKKDGRMKALSKKARGDDDFFAGLMEDAQKEEKTEEDEEEEEEESDSDSD